MSLLVWNCQGLGNQRTRRKLRDLIWAKDPFIVLIAETWCRHRILYPLQLGPPFPNNVEILQVKVGIGLSQIEIDLRKMFWEKYNSFMNKISYFQKIKTREILGHAYTYMRMRMHAQDLRAHSLCMHTHARVLETIKDKFFCIKVWFWNKLHIIQELFQTQIFFTIKNHKQYIFKTHRKS